MKKLTKTICALLVLSMLMCFGCTTNGNPIVTWDKDDITDGMLGPDTGEVSFAVSGSNAEVALWNSLKSGFEAKYPGCTVKLDFISSDYSNTVKRQLAANNSSDVVQVELSIVGDWARIGAIKGLGRFTREESAAGRFKQKDYFPSLIEMFSYSRKTKIRGMTDNDNAEIYALPKDIGITAIFVNEKIFNDFGISLPSQETPMTWSEYIALSKTIMNHSKNPSGQSHIFGTGPIDWQTYAYSLGAGVLKDGNRYLNADDDNLIKAMQTAADMQRNGTDIYSAPSEADRSDSEGVMTMFKGGRMGMFWGGRWLVPQMESLGFPYRVIPLPVDNRDQPSYIPAASVGYAMARNTKKAKLAWKLINYLASEEGYKQMATVNYAVPGLQTIINDEIFTNPSIAKPGTKLSSEDAKVFLRQAPYTILPYAALLTTTKWVEIFNNKVAPLWAGTQSDARSVLKGMEKEVNRAIKNNEPQLFA